MRASDAPILWEEVTQRKINPTPTHADTHVGSHDEVERARELARVEDQERDENGVIGPCVVCLVNRRAVVFKPCHHMVCCEACAMHEDMVACPMCRADIMKKKKLFV